MIQTAVHLSTDAGARLPQLAPFERAVIVPRPIGVSAQCQIGKPKKATDHPHNGASRVISFSVIVFPDSVAAFLHVASGHEEPTGGIEEAEQHGATMTPLLIAVSGRRSGEIAPTNPQPINWHKAKRPSAIPKRGMYGISRCADQSTRNPLGS